MLDGTATKQLLLVYNPVAGRKQIKRFLSEIVCLFSDQGYVVTIFPTCRRMAATEFVAKFGSRFDRIVCASGDGTFSECVAGMAQAGISIPLGHIPCGSSNDFAACHNLPTDIMTAARRAMEGQEEALDIGCFNGRYFTYIAAFGAFSWLCYTTSQTLKNILGHTAYILDGIKDFPMIKPEHMRVHANGIVYEGDYIFGAVCNCTSVAGAFDLPPQQVDMCDGLFEVILIREPANMVEWQILLSSLVNQEYSGKLIDFFKAERVVVESAGNFTWALDGEQQAGSPEIEIVNVRNLLRIVC